jgi:hypothetical protein
MQKRCASSLQAVAKAIRPVFNSNNVKGSFFLVLLPDTIDSIIDNLSTKDITAFTKLEPKMLDISNQHSLNIVENTSLTAQASLSASLQARKKAAQLLPTSRRTPANAKECT